MKGQVCPWGPWRLMVQLALLFAFLFLTEECLRLTDRAPSRMHRCSVTGASFDVNLAKFNAIVSDSNSIQPFHQGHFRIILFFMCILKYGSKFWATLPELELIISFQQATNALCLGSKAVSLFFSFGVGNFKVGLLSYEAFNSRVKFRSEAFVYLLLLASELSRRLSGLVASPMFY